VKGEAATKQAQIAAQRMMQPDLEAALIAQRITIAELVRAWRARPITERTGKTREIHGEVVDVRGRPVAGASVMADNLLLADSVGIGLPSFALNDDLRSTITDDAGHFVISDLSDVARAGAIAAQLEPTHSVSGTVELGGILRAGRGRRLLRRRSAPMSALRIGVADRGSAVTSSYIEFQTHSASPVPITNLRLAIASSNGSSTSSFTAWSRPRSEAPR